MTRLLLVLLVMAGLQGCAARGVIGLAPGGAVPGGDLRAVFLATNRTVGDGRLADQDFGAARDATLRFARMDISIPPGHAPGRIEWPGRATPDPARHFVTRTRQGYASQARFLSAIDAAMPRGRNEVVLFVHGYNVNNAEAVYRLAQIAHDYEADLPVVAYSWPSAGDPRGYVYDRDSVIFSRDGLEQLLAGLTANNRRVLIVAHSMGSQLVMEVLRQMSIAGRDAVLRNLSGVALISPDIDEDVFLQQARRIRPFPQPFMVMVSSRDRVLDVSAFLTGKPTRVGSISDPERLDTVLPVDVIDLSDVEGGDRGGHMTAFTAPAAIARLRELGELRGP